MAIVVQLTCYYVNCLSCHREENSALKALVSKMFAKLCFMWIFKFFVFSSYISPLVAQELHFAVGHLLLLFEPLFEEFASP